MQKKLLPFIILVSFVFYSCLDYSLPEKIELELEGSINLPVKTSTSNWGSIVIEKLMGLFSGVEGIEIYDVNYPGQNVGAFCCVYSYEMSEPFDPDEYLKKINALTQFGGLENLKLNYPIPIPSFDDIPFPCPSVPIPINVPSGIPSIPFPESIIIPINEFEAPLNSIKVDFLHAKIGAESFLSVKLVLSEDNIILPPLEYIYDLHLSQAEDDKGDELGKYPGLNYPDPSNPNNQTSGKIDLIGQNINKQDVKIWGTVTLKPKSAGSFITIKDPDVSTVLTGNLEMEMNIKNIAEIDLDFKTITDALEDKLQPDSISLETVALYLNWISFDKTESIGIKLTFSKETSEKIIEGLAMSVECDALDFKDEPQDLKPGPNMFGNKDKFTLYLKNNKDNKKPVEKLNFNIKLLPSGINKKVLKLTDLVPGEELWIEGDPELVLDWTEAEVKMSEVLKATGQSEELTGEFPETEHIDLSIPDDYSNYFDGFEFKRIMASVYLSGPDKMIQSIYTLDPTLSLKALYNEETLPIMTGKIKLEEKRVDIKNNDKYTYKDKNENTIYKSNGLPPSSLGDFKFVDIINAHPADLFFQYDVKLPLTINVKPSMFKDDNDENNKVDPKIAVTIIILIHLELKAGDKGGWIETGLFGDQIDLFGRENPGEDSVFTSLNVDYINVAIDLAGTLTTHANLFIEKNNDDESKLLFPKGIPMNGSKIAVNITNKKLDIIRKNLINPDLRFVFDPGGTIAIPKKIGLTSVKIEAKGKNTLILDF